MSSFAPPSAPPLPFSPGKSAAAFRVYESNTRVAAHYRAMRENQSLAYVDAQLARYAPPTFGARAPSPGGAAALAAAGVSSAAPPGVVLTIREMFAVLRGFVDAADPDTELPNLEHMMQTAERARAAGAPDWLQLTALLHDCGKAMFLWGGAADGQEGAADGAQWALGGDTWVVGARIPDSAVHAEFNALNPDMRAGGREAEPDGVYARGCGLAALKLAWGHDEYMALWCRANANSLPEEARAIFRYHSCYPLHERGEYAQFLAPGDEALLEAVRRFQKFDLYSKSDERPDVDKLWPYYEALIAKYIHEPGGRCKW